jgi:hypothetical protein
MGIYRTLIGGKFVKKGKLFLFSAFFALIFALTSCSSEMPDTASDTAVSDAKNNVLINTNAGVPAITPQSAALTVSSAAAPYTFEISGFGEKYIITATPENGGANILFTAEDNAYNSTDYMTSAPEGFVAETLSKTNCFVIKAPKDNPNVPDLLQVNFRSTTDSAKSVAVFYSVRARELLPVTVYTTIPYNLSELSFCEDTNLIRTEDYKFMPPPVVTWNAEGVPSVKIYTYTFDTNRMSLTKAAESVTPDNQLYFAYAAVALADDVAGVFTTKTLTTSSETEFISIKNADTAENEHYFPVSDPRFSSTEELIAFSNVYFAPEITAELYRNAPQKYRDINGRLYTQRITVDAPPRFPVIADILEEDTDLSVLLSGGGTIVIRNDGTGNFLIMKYSLV